jgi:hypothetical protein
MYPSGKPNLGGHSSGLIEVQDGNLYIEIDNNQANEFQDRLTANSMTTIKDGKVSGLATAQMEQTVIDLIDNFRINNRWNSTHATQSFANSVTVKSSSKPTMPKRLFFRRPGKNNNTN